jgi:hypothetical protein
VTRTLVAVATSAERAALLPRSLGSLRPQCDALHVYLNGYREAPQCVLELACEHVVSPEDGGAEKKLHWAHAHAGIYLSCDDDFVYPPDYVSRMVEAVERWRGEAFVTAHGITFPSRPRSTADRLRDATLAKRTPRGAWVNHAGTGVLAWDARRIKPPLTFPVRNRCDVQLSAWANAQGIPIWVVPHEPRWLQPIPNSASSISAESRRERHATNNALLRAHPEWRVHEVQGG